MTATATEVAGWQAELVRSVRFSKRMRQRVRQQLGRRNHHLDIAMLVLAGDTGSMPGDHIAHSHIDLGLQQLGFRIMPKGMVGLEVRVLDPKVLPDPLTKATGDVCGRAAARRAWYLGK